MNSNSRTKKRNRKSRRRVENRSSKYRYQGRDGIMTFDIMADGCFKGQYDYKYNPLFHWDERDAKKSLIEAYPSFKYMEIELIPLTKSDNRIQPTEHRFSNYRKKPVLNPFSILDRKEALWEER